MLRLILITAFFSLTALINTCVAQSVSDDDTTVYSFADKMPEFDGNLYEWLANHIIYPTEARKRDEQGKVVLQFIIEKNGIVTNGQVLKSSGYPLLDEEGIRLLKIMPPWNPAKQSNKPIRIRYTLPIAFKQN